MACSSLQKAMASEGLAYSAWIIQTTLIMGFCLFWAWSLWSLWTVALWKRSILQFSENKHTGLECHNGE